jgi:hypothetical protein
MIFSLSVHWTMFSIFSTILIQSSACRGSGEWENEGGLWLMNSLCLFVAGGDDGGGAWFI